jgi:hypothetical protein
VDAVLTFPPITEEQRELIPNECLAYHVNLKPKTTRDSWAGLGRGPIAPVRVNGRVYWRTADVRKLLGVGGSR